MLAATLDRKKGILRVRPSGPLEEKDFEKLASLADPYIARKGKLAGLIVQVKSFPGWKNLAGLVQHIRFVRGHHRKVRKVALVTDARVGAFAVRFARHFVAADVKRFAAGQVREAKAWILK